MVSEELRGKSEELECLEAADGCKARRACQAKIRPFARAKPSVCKTLCVNPLCQCSTAVLQKTVNRLAKRALLHAERPPFTA